MDKNKIMYYLNHETELPEFCYGVSDVEAIVIVIKRGVCGYYPAKCDIHKREESQKFAKERNEELGISPEQAEAMKIKSIGGWN